MILVGLLSLTAGLFLLRTAFAADPDPRLVVANALGVDGSRFGVGTQLVSSAGSTFGIGTGPDKDARQGRQPTVGAGAGGGAVAK